MIILGFLSLIFDVLILNFSKYLFSNLSLLFPYLTLTYLICNFYFFNLKNKKIIIILSILYGIVINNIALTLINVSIIWLIIKFFKNNFKDSFFSFFIMLITCIFLYDFLSFLFLSLPGLISFNIFNFIYKFYNSTFLNILYGLVLYFLNSVLLLKNSNNY